MMAAIIQKFLKHYSIAQIMQVIDAGFFHADPHEGNIIVRDQEIVWIDLGMTGSLKSLPRGQRIEAAITKFCAERTVDEVEAIMNKAGIPNQKAFGPADIEKSAQYAARDDIATWTDSIYGEMKGIGITNKFKKNPAQIVASAPTFGEHSREVLSFLGYTDEQIDDKYAKGITATMDPRETAQLWHLKDWQFFWRDDQAEKLDL